MAARFDLPTREWDRAAAFPDMIAIRKVLVNLVYVLTFRKNPINS